MNSGEFVYMIVNDVDGRVYIGKTNSPARRWRAHRCHSCNAHLRAAMNYHGVESFSFFLIEKHDAAAGAYEAESFLIEYLRFCGAEFYNLTAGGEGSPSPSLHTREKLRQVFTGRVFSNETRRRMASAARARPPITHETRKRLSESHKNPSEQTRKKLSDSAKRRQSAGRQGWNRVHERAIEQLDALGHVIAQFASITAAARQTSTSRGLISAVLNGHRSFAKGFRWRYVE
jgi:group I intron endonuclease